MEILCCSLGEEECANILPLTMESVEEEGRRLGRLVCGQLRKTYGEGTGKRKVRLCKLEKHQREFK